MMRAVTLCVVGLDASAASRQPYGQTHYNNTNVFL